MIWLALIGVVEAVVYQARYRSAVLGGPFVAAWWTFATQALRVVWLAIGVGELMHGADLVLVIAAYGFPAAIAVGVMRWIDERRITARDRVVWVNSLHATPLDDIRLAKERAMETRRGPSLNKFVSDHERADAEKWSASRIEPTNTERRS